MRELELSELARVGAGEGALLVAEQLRFHQRLRDGRHVDRDKGLAGPRAALVNGARHQLLAGPALAGDEDGGRRLRDLDDELIDPRHLRMTADHAVEGPVAGLDGATGRCRAQAEPRALERAFLERALHEPLDVGGVERLDQIVIRAESHRFDGGADVTHGGGEDHDDRRIERVDAGQNRDPLSPGIRWSSMTTSISRDRKISMARSPSRASTMSQSPRG